MNKMIIYHRRARGGFSLLEVLLATFILGIGLIMVASVFPVGANWTRQGTEESVGQTIALNAVSILKGHYSPSSADANHAGQLSSLPGGTPPPLQALPNFVGINGIPVAERCYQFGNPLPFPATNPTVCLYYWTALARQTPNSNGATHDLFVFVFRKGEANQTFTSAGAIANASDPAASTPAYFPSNYQATFEPILVQAAFSGGTWNTNAVNGPVNTVIGAIPPVGYIGVGASTGTVFRQTININYASVNSTTALPQPMLLGNPPTEPVIYAPAADGTAGSPLIYVYQTTLPF